MAKEKQYLVINFKTYLESSGANAVRIARLVESSCGKGGKSLEVAVVPGALDLRAVAAVCKRVKVFGQHADPLEPGRTTGWLPVGNFKAAGAAGILINHAEHQLPADKIRSLIELCRKAGMTSLVCVKDDTEAAAIAAFKPDIMSVEPPELIGSGISVSTAKPDLVTLGVHAVHKTDADIPVICGAGISSGADVAKALELGAKGVLMSSYITRSKKPADAISEILSGFL